MFAKTPLRKANKVAAQYFQVRFHLIAHNNEVCIRDDLFDFNSKEINIMYKIEGELRKE